MRPGLAPPTFYPRESFQKEPVSPITRFDSFREGPVREEKCSVTEWKNIFFFVGASVLTKWRFHTPIVRLRPERTSLFRETPVRVLLPGGKETLRKTVESDEMKDRLYRGTTVVKRAHFAFLFSSQSDRTMPLGHVIRILQLLRGCSLACCITCAPEGDMRVQNAMKRLANSVC